MRIWLAGWLTTLAIGCSPDPGLPWGSWGLDFVVFGVEQMCLFVAGFGFLDTPLWCGRLL